MSIMQRKLAPFVLAASMASTSCAGRTLPPDPPKVVRTVKEDKDWLWLARDITNPSQFKVWEPILEEMTGKKPVSAENIFFIKKNEVQKYCSFPSAGGCYIIRSLPPNQIFLVVDPQWETQLAEQSERYHPSKGELWGIYISPLRLWSHEQGHHFDNHKLSGSYDGPESLIQELEAVAFEQYFAEHLAKNYDQILGLNWLRDYTLNIRWRMEMDNTNYGCATFGSIMPKEGNYSHMLEQVLDPATSNNESYTEALSHTDKAMLLIYPLLASIEGSFADVWHFIHTHSRSEVVDAIKRNALKGADGISKSERLLFSLVGEPLNSDFFNAKKAEAMADGFNFERYIGLEKPISENSYIRFRFDKYLLEIISKKDGYIYVRLRDSLKGNNNEIIEYALDPDPYSEWKKYVSIRDENFEMKFEIKETNLSTKASVFAYSRRTSPSYCHIEEEPLHGSPTRYLIAIRHVFDNAIDSAERSGADKKEVKFARGAISQIFGK